jgi:hypothetical protein
MATKRLWMAGILVAGIVLVTSSARAADVTASGKNMFVNKVLESFKLPDGNMAMRVLSSGFITADDPANPLSLASMTCSGTSVNRGETTVRGAGTCDSVDADGHIAFFWWRFDEGSGGQWGFLGGTGKWTGVEGGGTYAPGQAWKDGRSSNTWKGSWKSR